MPDRSNWAGNVRYGAGRLHEPGSVEEVQEIVRSARKLRVLGSAHSFSTVADTTGDHLSLARLPRVFELDATSATVTIDGAVAYGELGGRLHAAGVALHNLASLPHISVAGACATGTHGSGDRSGSLPTAVSALEIVAADGEIRSLRRERREDDLAGAVVSLGALGVVVSMTLDIGPTYFVRQDVYEGLPFAAVLDHFDEVTSAADSVSLFTAWRAPTFEQAWLKRRVSPDQRPGPPPAFFGARPASEDLHPIRGMDAEACTPQLGLVGPWHERLPHFRMDHTPSAGNELQSEYIVPRRHALSALRAIEPLRARIAPLLAVSEVRTIAGDDLWLSPSSGEASVAIHFTWQPDWPGVRRLLPSIEAALEPFAPRPHWGKLFTIAGQAVRARYPRLPEFIDLARRYDPEGTFRNDFLDRHVFGALHA